VEWYLLSVLGVVVEEVVLVVWVRISSSPYGCWRVSVINDGFDDNRGARSNAWASARKEVLDNCRMIGKVFGICTGAIKAAATHHRHIWAMFECMYGKRIVGDGDVQVTITARANSDHGPHSLEWGLYVKDNTSIHCEFS
jgi:hypothetical protein